MNRIKCNMIIGTIFVLITGILAGTFLMPALYYSYTSVTGKGFLIIDIGIFILCTIIAFFAAYRLTLSCRLKPYTFILCALVFSLLVCFFIFTYNPPDLAIFAEPAAS